jgi:hypothetical protein
MWDIVKVLQRRPQAVEVTGGALGELLAASRSADGTKSGRKKPAPERRGFLRTNEKLLVQ